MPLDQQMNLLDSFVAAAAAAEATFGSLTGWTALTGGQQVTLGAVRLLNLDLTNAVYLADSAALWTAGTYSWVLPPNMTEPVLILIGYKPFQNMAFGSLAGTPNFSVALYQR